MKPGSETKDEQQTWDIECKAGIPGGCKGLNPDQLQEFNQRIGRENGASPTQKPLVLSDFGRCVGRTWRTPHIR